MTQDSDLIHDCKALITSCKTLILATANEESSHSSYAPFIYYNNNFYILVSALAKHTSQMQSTQRPIGCMLVTDETQSSQIFARCRLMFNALPKLHDRHSKQWPILIDRFKHRFGDIINLLDSLPDFSIFELTPKHAVLVRGFGDAQHLPDDWLGSLE